MQDALWLIRLAAISEKLIMPTKQVNANRQKQKVIRKVTTAFSAVPGVSSAAEDRNLGKRSMANHVSEVGVSHI